MKYVLDHDYHIHSYLSQCSSDPEQSSENILKHAKSQGLKKIAMTDHFWDERVPGASEWYSTYHKFSDISRALPLPADEDVSFIFGCEADMDKNGVIGLSGEISELFDFIIVSTTHLHMKGFTVKECDYGKPDRLARLWVERLDTLLSSPLPFGKVGVAHLSTACIAPQNNLHLEALRLIPDADAHDLFARAARLGVGIELNAHDFLVDRGNFETVLHPFRIAKECGCKFYLGSDTHKPREFCYYNNLECAVEMLALTEDDKFIISK